MFEGFEEFDVRTTDSTVHGVVGGSGPPVLLLHGIPETHLMWAPVAARLAARHTVVATDLRGYGASGTPPSTVDHAPYAMRAVAAEQVEVMRALGHETFAVAGHDRGARCAFRLAHDHPEAVTALAVMDVVPTGDAYARADARFALGYWVWSFLAAPSPVPEELIARSPATLVDHMLEAWPAPEFAFPAAARDAYVRQFEDPATVHAICEQYRAAATLDVAHDDADRGRRKLECPVLALWGAGGPVDQWYDPLELWGAWADDLRGGALPCGHFLPEERPDDVADRLLDLLAGRRERQRP